MHYQAGYRPYFNSTTDTLALTGDKSQQQYYVVGTAIGIYTFTLTPTSVNTGISKTVTVTVVSSGPRPGAGDAHDGELRRLAVTITSPATTVFSQSSVVSFATGAPVVVTARSADSTKITFVVGPNITGPATVSKVGFLFSPTANVVSISSTNSLVTGAAPVTLSAASAAVGAPVTATMARNAQIRERLAHLRRDGHGAARSRCACGVGRQHRRHLHYRSSARMVW